MLSRQTQFKSNLVHKSALPDFKYDQTQPRTRQPRLPNQSERQLDTFVLYIGIIRSFPKLRRELEYRDFAGSN